MEAPRSGRPRPPAAALLQPQCCALMGLTTEPHPPLLLLSPHDPPPALASSLRLLCFSGLSRDPLTPPSPCRGADPQLQAQCARRTHSSISPHLSTRDARASICERFVQQKATLRACTCPPTPPGQMFPKAKCPRKGPPLFPHVYPQVTCDGLRSVTSVASLAHCQGWGTPGLGRAHTTCPTKPSGPRISPAPGTASGQGGRAHLLSHLGDPRAPYYFPRFLPLGPLPPASLEQRQRDHPQALLCVLPMARPEGAQR